MISDVGAMDPIEIEERLRALLPGTPPDVIAAYLFGSVGRGKPRDDSDVDVAVLLERDPAPTLEGLRLDLEAELERELGRSVQLVILNTAPPDLVHRVLRDGKLLLERNRSGRIRFEVRARNEYFDLQPILARYRGTGSAA